MRLWWGGIRNLLCGVTTVCHHNPISPDLLDPGFPVRIVSDFGWAHSLSLDPQLASKFAKSASDAAFHSACCGGRRSRRAWKKYFELDRMHALDDRTVLVHGLACTPVAVSLINQRLAALSCAPHRTSFSFTNSLRFRWSIRSNKVMLGSDSPLTAAGDLLDEIRFAHTQIGLDANSLYGMVTNQPADSSASAAGRRTIETRVRRGYPGGSRSRP